MLILVNDVFVEVLPPLVSVFPFGGIVAVLSDLLELLLPREEEFVVNLLIKSAKVVSNSLFNSGDLNF